MSKTNALFEECLQMVSPEITKRTQYTYDVADRIYELLNNKGISQKKFAQMMGKKESQISRWLQGTHNFTLETLANISNALGEDIINVSNRTQVNINAEPKFQCVFVMSATHPGTVQSDWEIYPSRDFNIKSRTTIIKNTCNG